MIVASQPPLPLRAVLVAAALTGAVSMASLTPAYPKTDLFDAFVGEWSGTGEVTSAKGDREHIRCRATYSAANEVVGLSQSIVCASPSFRVDVESYVEGSGGALHGTWRETTRDASGRLTGRIQGGDFEGSVVGAGFTAQISLRSDGRHQSVHITPSGTDIGSVSIELDRQG